MAKKTKKKPRSKLRDWGTATVTLSWEELMEAILLPPLIQTFRKLSKAVKSA